MVYCTVKPVCFQPVFETPILLHQCDPFATDFKLVGHLRTTVIVHYRVDFLATFLEMEPVQNSLPSGNEIVKLQVGDGGWRGTDVLDGDSEKSWILRRAGHLDHIGVCLHYQLRAISCQLRIDVPD